MNNDEKIVCAYLSTHYTKVCFEPDGNIPPDFSINENIAVEVRRLNQQYRKNGNSEGLEKQGIPLLKTINDELSKYDTRGFWLEIHFCRDIDKNKVIKKNIENAIKAFEDQNEKIPFSYKIGNNITLNFISEFQNRKYKIGMESDLDNGGWVVPMYIKEIQHCIEEKKKKVSRYLHRYNSWWLILIDSIMGVTDDDISKIVSQLKKPACFAKILILDNYGSKLIEI
jgi:hypothetical protein